MATPENLVYWIYERESVRKHKEAGEPKPWSQDPIFQTTYFTNVRREDDKVTRFVRAWTEGCDRKFLTPLLTLARMFNLPSHLQELPDWKEYGQYEFWAPRAKEATLTHRARGNKLFNGAYLITTCGVKMDKVDYVYKVADDVDELIASGAKIGLATPQIGDSFMSLSKAHHQLTRVNGLGSFLAAQIIADLKNTYNHPLEHAVDWWTWCAPGPGSLRGIRCIEGFENTSEGQFLGAASNLYAQCRLGEGGLPRISMQDFQNCLCEFSKYVRVKQGGRSKRKYDGR